MKNDVPAPSAIEAAFRTAFASLPKSLETASHGEFDKLLRDELQPEWTHPSQDIAVLMCRNGETLFRISTSFILYKNKFGQLEAANRQFQDILKRLQISLGERAQITLFFERMVVSDAPPGTKLDLMVSGYVEN